jgi:large subunit ribosomal protein L35
MPKIKTNSGAAKRFKKTGTGKIKRSCAFTSHILTSKTRKRKRNLRHGGLVSAADQKNVAKLIPYM